MSLSDSQGTARKFFVENVQVFNESGSTEFQNVIIHNGIISNNQENADETINGEGRFLTPGLVDAHIRLHHTGHL
ncbi:hydrolase [Penicillium canescens]|nr:hydrolase [Penicillium canescens]